MHDTDEIKSMLRRSLDRKVYLRSLWGVVIAVPVSLAYCQFRYSEVSARMLLILAPVIAVFVLSWGLRLARLYRQPEGYIIVKATLGTSGQWYSKSGVSLPVYLEDPWMGPVTARTNRIFHRRGFAQPLLADYENRTVTVAYNRYTDVVVVIE
ncbi:MAG: hypothetical protein IJ960_08890 [Oscillospiraceae bacterium]|nr:hypothetical protein [Oscillospiraceae bacterium]